MATSTFNQQQAGAFQGHILGDRYKACIHWLAERWAAIGRPTPLQSIESNQQVVNVISTGA